MIDALTEKINMVKLNNYCQNNEVLVLYLFGSQLTTDTDKFSDIDLGVVFCNSAKEKIFRSNFYINFKSDIKDFFDFREIDLIFMQKAGIKIKFNIVCNGEVLFSRDDNKRLDYEDMIIRKGLDFNKEMELHYKELEESIIEEDSYGK